MITHTPPVASNLHMKIWLLYEGQYMHTVVTVHVYNRNYNIVTQDSFLKGIIILSYDFCVYLFC